MTISAAISRAIQGIALTVIGGLLGLIILTLLATGFIDKAFGNVIDTLHKASDGVAWEGRP